VNLEQTHGLLTLIAAFDNRRFDDVTVIAWQQVLAAEDPAHCRTAVIEHFRTSTDYLMPAHVVEGAERARREHLRALAAQTRPALVAIEGGTGVRNRSADATALVEVVRRTLPPGDPDTLRHGRRYWRQAQAAHRRAATAEPNPLFDPQALARLAQETADQPNNGGN
jgi:hypothetical protein